MKSKISILFIGNSHTFVNYVPAIVHDMFKQVGVDANCVMITIGGKCMEFHANQPNTKYNILHGNYDYVVLQNKATNFDPVSYLENGKKIFDEMISKTSTKPVIYFTWQNKGKNAELAPITDAALALAEHMDALIAPAGAAWKKARRCRPAPELYSQDGNHATVYGSYLAAGCIFYAISGRTRALHVTDGEQPHTRLGIETKMAATLQRVACKTTAEYRK